jgi:hypothetical protein
MIKTSKLTFLLVFGFVCNIFLVVSMIISFGHLIQNKENCNIIYKNVTKDMTVYVICDNFNYCRGNTYNSYNESLNYIAGLGNQTNVYVSSLFCTLKYNYDNLIFMISFLVLFVFLIVTIILTTLYLINLVKLKYEELPPPAYQEIT